VLYGRLVGMVASPLTGLATSLNGLIGGIARQLQAIADQGLVGGDAPAPAAAEPDTDAGPTESAEAPGPDPDPAPESAETPDPTPEPAGDTPSDTENQED
jgi:large subunit ribosomal protein L10